VQARSQLAARILVQIGRRAGTGARKLLRVPEHEEPKACADFLRAAAWFALRGEEWASSYSSQLAERLLGLSYRTEAGRGWGLAFPYASRFVNAGAAVPNLYVTTAACQALLDYHELSLDSEAREAAEEGGRFIVDGLGSFQSEGNTWLRYWPGLESRTINVQASAAALLARLGRMEAADEAAAVVVATQRPDGSWPYSAGGRASFVDGFHTGFTLQGLSEYSAVRAERSSVADEAVRRGFAYFEQHLLTRDGLPRSRADGRVGLDGQNLSQCIQTFVVCGGPDRHAQAVRLWRAHVVPLLAGGAGRFMTLRWEVGPAVLATAYLAAATGSTPATADSRSA
jgi:hypothetical protein